MIRSASRRVQGQSQRNRQKLLNAIVTQDQQRNLNIAVQEAIFNHKPVINHNGTINHKGTEKKLRDRIAQIVSTYSGAMESLPNKRRNEILTRVSDAIKFTGDANQHERETIARLRKDLPINKRQLMPTRGSGSKSSGSEATTARRCNGRENRRSLMKRSLMKTFDLTNANMEPIMAVYNENKFVNYVDMLDRGDVEPPAGNINQLYFKFSTAAGKVAKKKAAKKKAAKAAANATAKARANLTNMGVAKARGNLAKLGLASRVSQL